MELWVKICGVTSEAAVEAAVGAGADAVGFVFYPKSPRHLSMARAVELGGRVRGQAERVALMVDPDDALVDEVVGALAPDLIQLHGRESPERVAALRRRTGRPVMKVLGVGAAEDLAALADYAGVADRLLLDAKPSAEAVLPGGNGRAFDWALLAALDPKTPFVLSGGLDALNVAAAIEIARPVGVDVSSGVESAPGIKDPARIAAFVAAARSIAQGFKP